MIFNGLSGALYEIDDQEYYQAQQCFEHPNDNVSWDNAFVQALVTGGFLIPADRDEVTAIIEAGVQESEHPTILDLTISPTYQCNFRCTYCYVDFVQGQMSDEDGNRICQFLEHSLGDYKQFNLTWFGGEPLLCMDFIERINPQIGNICTRKGLRFYSFLTTNGYLLTTQNISRLIKAGIRYFHVTIDGPAVTHDRLRVRANGSPTHAQILRNILILLADFPDTRLTLRINVSDDTIEVISDLFLVIPLEYRSRVQLNIMPIEGLPKPPSPELYRKIHAIYAVALQMGFAYYSVQLSNQKCTYCCADKKPNFQIGPNTQVYKCSPSGKPEVHVGWLGQGGILYLNEKFEKWHETPMILEKCKECPYFCFCLGGCRLKRIRGVSMQGCQSRYLDLEHMIQNYYLALQTNLSDDMAIKGNIHSKR